MSIPTFDLKSQTDPHSISTVRAMISENSTKKTQARAFSYFAFAGNLGIFTGPLIGMWMYIRSFHGVRLTYGVGGALERPAEKFGSVFGQMRFLRKYPYALPGFVVASIGLSAALIATCFVKEVW